MNNDYLRFKSNPGYCNFNACTTYSYKHNDEHAIFLLVHMPYSFTVTRCNYTRWNWILMTLFNVCMQFFYFYYVDYKAPSLKSLKARRAARSKSRWEIMLNKIRPGCRFSVAHVLNLNLSFLQYCVLWIFEGLTL